jgi:hypothetical protein
MNIIDEKIKEMGKFVEVVSFDKGSDNYNKLQKILLEIYQAGVEGKSLIDSDLVDDVLNNEDYPLNHD